MIEYNVLENGQVMKVERVDDTVIETHHCMFYAVTLQTDKTEITADGVDVAKVTAIIRNWQGQLTGEDREMAFIVNGNIVAAFAINGVATINVTATEPGEIIVRSMIPGYDNGGVIIRAN